MRFRSPDRQIVRSPDVLRLAAGAAAVALGVLLPAAPLATVASQRPSTPSGSVEILLEQFGAVCDGVADDSAALERAFAAAAGPPARTLRLPGRTCAFARPIVIGGGRDYAAVSVTGVSENASLLLYTGPARGAALTLSHVAYFRWQNLSVSKQNGADFTTHGSSTGILLTGPGKSGGTMTLAGEFNHVAVSGFHYGMVFGADEAASEIVCYHCRFALNDVGWTAGGYNALNFLFLQVDLLGNRRGMEIGGDGTFGRQATDGPHVIGGATADNSEADFFIGNPFGTTTIENVRAEPKARFVKGPAAGRLTLRGNAVTRQTQAGDGVLVELGHFDSVLLANNTFEGMVSAGLETGGGAGVELTMQQNVVASAPSGLPVLLPARSRGITLTLERNRVYAAGGGQRPFPDFRGTMTSALVPTSVTASSAGDPVPGGGLWLTAVRMLAYGSGVTGRNLRDRVTFSGQATQTHTFKRTLPVSTVNGRTIRVAAGALTAADIGKTLMLPGANQKLCTPPATPATDAVYARIVALIDDTRAVVATMASGDGRCLQEITEARAFPDAVIGEDEPDADYFLLLSCNASERIYWRDKTARGFTLVSDNAQSRAVCDVLIVR